MESKSCGALRDGQIWHRGVRSLEHDDTTDPAPSALTTSIPPALGTRAKTQNPEQLLSNPTSQNIVQLAKTINKPKPKPRSRKTSTTSVQKHHSDSDSDTMGAEYPSISHAHDVDDWLKKFKSACLRNKETDDFRKALLFETACDDGSSAEIWYQAQGTAVQTSWKLLLPLLLSDSVPKTPTNDTWTSSQNSSYLTRTHRKNRRGWTGSKRSTHVPARLHLLTPATLRKPPSSSETWDRKPEPSSISKAERPSPRFARNCDYSTRTTSSRSKLE